MKKADHILVVDDDTEIRNLLHDYLVREGFEVSVAGDGRGMERLLVGAHIDLVVLDWMLPGEDGISLCRRLRAKSQVPVIMLTARGAEPDRIAGLETGADDYLPKPFNPRELLARIRGVLRRVRHQAGAAEPDSIREYRFGGWCLMVPERQLRSPEAVTVPLSGAEFRLLLVFLQHAHKVLSRDQLVELLRGQEAALPFDRSLDMQVSRLRRRLHDDGHDPTFIRSVRGEGYVFIRDVESVS